VRRWTPERIAEVILEAHSAGLGLASSDVVRREPALMRAAVRHCGSWDRALRLAGLNPVECRKRRAWSEAEVLGELRQMAQSGHSLTWTKAHRRRPDLVAAACSDRRFGSWRAALEAAGLGDVGRRMIRRWDALAVREGILQRRRSGQALNAGALETSDAALLSAARRIYGSWNTALEAAGLDPEAYIQRKRRPKPKGNAR